MTVQLRIRPERALLFELGYGSKALFWITYSSQLAVDQAWPFSQVAS